MDLNFGDSFGSKIILKSRSILQDGSRFWDCFGRKQHSDTKFISIYLTVRSHIRQDFDEKSRIIFSIYMQYTSVKLLQM